MAGAEWLLVSAPELYAGLMGNEYPTELHRATQERHHTWYTDPNYLSTPAQAASLFHN